MKHNRLWFKNRIGKRIYCDDHLDLWKSCKGIEVLNEHTVEHFLECQEKSKINFSDEKI